MGSVVGDRFSVFRKRRSEGKGVVTGLAKVRGSSEECGGWRLRKCDGKALSVIGFQFS